MDYVCVYMICTWFYCIERCWIQLRYEFSRRRFTVYANRHTDVRLSIGGIDSASGVFCIYNTYK